MFPTTAAQHVVRGWSVTWETSADVDDFLAASGRFLASDPVRNTVLLTEADFWRRLPTPPPGARFGWWVDHGEVRAAFVQVPDHDPICTSLTASSATALPDVLADAAGVGVEEADVDAVTRAWQARGRSMQPKGRVTILRLETPRAQVLPEGRPRVAGPADLPLLREWFDLFQQRYPGDPSQVEFVVDHPVAANGVVLWEVGERPVAMASRTPEVAGMVRMGLAFQPTSGSTYADAALAVACAEAAGTTKHVLAISGGAEATAGFRALGFIPVLNRVLLRATTKA
jgi:hypothetical protein